MIIFRLCLLAIFVVLYPLFLSAQVYQVFNITPEGRKGKLQRVEIYDNQLLIRKTEYSKGGQADYTIRKTYTDDGLLAKRVQTFHEEYEYDLIRQYSYNDKGQKIGELFGNNRTGKWGNYRYEYNEKGLVQVKHIYQKNGDLSHQQLYDYQHDEKGRVVAEKRSTKEIETESLVLDNHITHSYPKPHHSSIIIKNQEGNIVLSELLIQYPSKRQKELTTNLGGQDQFKEITTYNSNEKIIQKVEYFNGQLQKTTSYKYDKNGIRILEKQQLPDGTFAGVQYQLAK